MPRSRFRDASEQLPSAREVPGEKEREQQSNAFDRLDGSEIDLGGAARWSGAEEEQDDRKRKRRKQRHIAELEERDGAEVDQRHRGHEREADQNALDIASRAGRCPAADRAGRGSPRNRSRSEDAQTTRISASLLTLRSRHTNETM